MTIAILLADDHPIVRRGVRSLLEPEENFAIVGEAGDGAEFFRLLQAHQPQVAIFEPMMPGLNGVAALPRVARVAPQTQTVVLSMNGDEAFVKQALRNGANSYVLKGCTPAAILEAVREAAAGRRYLSPPLSAWAIDAYLAQVEAPPTEPFDSLTPREVQVLKLVATGKTSVQIGQQLAISPRTAEMHRANLMHKLGLRNQTTLVRFALQKGLLSDGQATS